MIRTGAGRDGFIMKFILALFLFSKRKAEALQDNKYEDNRGNSAQVGQNFSMKMVSKLGSISETAEDRPLPTLGRSSDSERCPSWSPFPEL